MRAGVAHDSEVSLCSYRILHDLGGQRRHRPNDPLFKRRLQSRFSTRSDSCFTFGRFAQLDEQLTTASFFLFAGFSFTPAQPASRSEDPGHRVPTCTCYAHPARLVRVGSPTRRHCDTLCPCPSLAPVRERALVVAVAAVSCMAWSSCSLASVRVFLPAENYWCGRTR